MNILKRKRQKNQINAAPYLAAFTGRNIWEASPRAAWLHHSLVFPVFVCKQVCIPSFYMFGYIDKDFLNLGKGKQKYLYLSRIAVQFFRRLVENFKTKERDLVILPIDFN